MNERLVDVEEEDGEDRNVWKFVKQKKKKTEKIN